MKGEVILRDENIYYTQYQDETQLPDMFAMIDKDLSEPYSIYTYRYFLHGWPQLSFLAFDENQEDKMIGVVVCKADLSKAQLLRGYIAMLAVDTNIRRRGIGSKLVKLAIRQMEKMGCDEVVLETEITNLAAMNLYQSLGFYRDKRLTKYYLSGVDAFRLKLWLTDVRVVSNTPLENTAEPENQ